MPIAVAVVWYIILALSNALGRMSVAGVRLPKAACLAGAILLVFAAGAIPEEGAFSAGR